MANRRIVCAALRDPETGIVILGPRHFDPTMQYQLQHAYPELRTRAMKLEQGFIDQHGRFLDRVESLAIAKAEGQILQKTGCDSELFSEDLY